MKATEITPAQPKNKHDRSSADRLTQMLIWAAFFLVAALAAIGADLALRPRDTGTVARAVGITPAPPTSLPVMSPSPLPTAEATQPLPSAAPLVATMPARPPAESGQAAVVTPEACIPPDDWTIHAIRSGNTLVSLAQRYNVSVDTLMYVNCLNTETVFINQQIYVPGPATDPTPPLVLTYGSARSGPTRTPRPGSSATPSSETPAADTLGAAATAQSPFRLNMPDHYLNILLLGSDKKPRGRAWRTDSMIIVSVDMQANVVRLLSIPRDLWVYIPGHGQNRVNTADLWGELARKGGGPERVKQTIYHNLGIPIHYWVRVDFAGFIKIIDTVGGVDVDVDCPLPDIDLSAGMHHFDGKNALRYARSRKSTSDFDRGRRQRKVLMALWDQALNLDIIPRLPELWLTMADSFQTDLPLEQVINLAYVGAQLEPQRIRSRSITYGQVQSWITPQGAAVLLPRPEQLRTLLDGFYAPLDTSSLDEVGKTSVRVLNGSQRRQAEQLAAAALRWKGFKVVGTGQADRQDYARTDILVLDGDLAAGEQLAQQLGVPVSAVHELGDGQPQPDLNQPTDIQVILGSDYNPCQR
jgi:LCP family protein required for cell wall assembly